MFKKVFTVVLLSVFALGFYYSDKLFAQETIAATVTIENIAISVSNENVAYGFLPLNTSRSTSGGTNPVGTIPTIQNTGNVPVDLDVYGANSADWTLAGTSGSDAYVHSFCGSSCTNPPTGYTALTTTPNGLTTNLAVSSTQTLDLRITTPTTSSTLDQQTLNVTVQASAS